MRTIMIRRTLFAVALAVCVTCWAVTFGTLIVMGRPDFTTWTVLVTVSAFATEFALWVGAATLGWSVFEKRRQIWARLTGSAREARQ